MQRVTEGSEMRILPLLSLILLLVIQCGFYVLALLYQAPAMWILAPVVTLAFYIYAARQARILQLGVLIASAAIGLLLSWQMIAGAVGFSTRESFPWLSSLLWGGTYFALSNALCLGGAALLQRVLSRSS